MKRKTINFQFLKLIFLYEFLTHLTLSVVIYAVLAVFNHPVVRKDFGQIQKNETACCVADRSVVPVEPNQHYKRLIEMNAEEKYLKRENLSIIPFLIDVCDR